jgi:hypothetical protein
MISEAAWGRSQLAVGRTMKILTVAGTAACVLLLVTAAGHAVTVADPYTVTIEQVGSNVVVTGTGEFDLSGLSLVGDSSGSAALIIPTEGILYLDSAKADYYSGLTGPTSFGTGGAAVASASSGGFVGISGIDSELFVPAGYTSGTLLNNVDTYDDATLASLGLSPGTYVWTWGGPTDPPDQSFTLDIGTTPLPAAVPLFATGLAALGFFGWRSSKRKPQFA